MVIVYNQLLFESLIIGVEVVVLTIIIRKMLSFFNVKINNDYIILFVTGTLMHIISEIIGKNAKYCRQGVACKKIQNNQS